MTPILLRDDCLTRIGCHCHTRVAHDQFTFCSCLVLEEVWEDEPSDEPVEVGSLSHYLRPDNQFNVHSTPGYFQPDGGGCFFL